MPEPLQGQAGIARQGREHGWTCLPRTTSLVQIPSHNPDVRRAHRHHTVLGPFAAPHEEGLLPKVNVADFQPQQFLPTQSHPDCRRQDCVVAVALEVGSPRVVEDLLEQQPRLVLWQPAGQSLLQPWQLDALKGTVLEVPVLYAPAEEHCQALVVGEECAGGPVALGASAVEELANYLRGALANQLNTHYPLKEPGGHAVPLDRVGGVPAKQRGVFAQLFAEGIDIHTR